MARQGIALRESPGGGILAEGRLVTAVVDIPGRICPIGLASGYLEVGTNLGEVNLQLLAALGQWANDYNGSWLAGWGLEHATNSDEDIGVPNEKQSGDNLGNNIHLQIGEEPR